MARLPYLDRHEVPADVQEVYDSTQKALGRVPNFHKLLAHSPKVLMAHLTLGAALRAGSLDPRLRELAYLKTSELNRCHY